jgi:hypothetical protein
MAGSAARRTRTLAVIFGHIVMRQRVMLGSSMRFRSGKPQRRCVLIAHACRKIWTHAAMRKGSVTQWNVLQCIVTDITQVTYSAPTKTARRQTTTHAVQRRTCAIHTLALSAMCTSGMLTCLSALASCAQIPTVTLAAISGHSATPTFATTRILTSTTLRSSSA